MSKRHISLSRALSAGSDLLGKNLGMLIAFSIIYLAIIVVGSMIPFISYVISYVVTPVLTIGFALLIDRPFKGETISLDSAFGGFKKVGELVLINLIIVIITAAIFIALLLPFVIGELDTILAMVEEMENLRSPEDMQYWIDDVTYYATALWPMLTIGTILTMMVQAAFLFAPYHVVLRNAKLGDAISAGWKDGWTNMHRLVGWSILFAILAFLGALMCGIGLLFVLPYGMVVQYIMFRQMYPPVIVGEAIEPSTTIDE